MHIDSLKNEFILDVDGSAVVVVAQFGRIDLTEICAARLLLTVSRAAARGPMYWRSSKRVSGQRERRIGLRS